jgi:hypothetical protein
VADGALQKSLLSDHRNIDYILDNDIAADLAGFHPYRI